MYTQALGGPGVWKRRAESTLTGHSTNYKNLRLYEEAIFLRLCCVIISHLRFICPVTSLFSSFGLDFISLLRDNNRDYSSLCILQIIKQSCNFFSKGFSFFHNFLSMVISKCPQITTRGKKSQLSFPIWKPNRLNCSQNSSFISFSCPSPYHTIFSWWQWFHRNMEGHGCSWHHFRS